jgi:hypothetical protein
VGRDRRAYTSRVSDVSQGSLCESGRLRAAFYYAQDWDLWYPLAALGTFAMIEQCLDRGRITPDSISSLRRDRQVAYARLSHEAIALRLAGHSDAAVVQEAELLPRKPHLNRRSDQGRAMYFIAKGLVDNNDPRATRYLLNAISLDAFLFRAWWWAAKSLARPNLSSDLR